MQSSSKIRIPTQTMDFLLFDEFSNHCLANTVEPLRAANTLSRRALYAWRFLTLDGAPVHSSSGLQVSPHDRLDRGRGSMLVVMPSYGFRTYEGWRTLRALTAAAKRYPTLAGLDTGSWLLARAGLLDGHRATIHWEELTSFAEAFPQVHTVRERFVIDGPRITCSGAMAAFDLVLHLVGRDHGQLLALEVAQLFMTRDSARSHGTPAAVGQRSVNKAVMLMQDNLERPLTIAEIARRAGCTQKTLEARMLAELDASPQAVYRRLRLNLARKLVTETDQPVSEIAGRCGYENASAMTRAFRAEFGQPPRSLRNGGQTAAVQTR
ncbi:GlxA family transcriptional regulator [Ruegeria marina]|uniref:Transcriptional regulator, AraC family with amidase-like domain n=1 Tax=Ruegeria marina TaxID=639004 RepID=A0A1G6UW10_9RHOB|nr:GlxA family transcriptional regulator [Ruegeria marina]SDD44837.1 transcriptional regulator, AraC family with amidase-like domain [Ruegeria marina]